MIAARNFCVFAALAVLFLLGCGSPHGQPSKNSEILAPNQILDFGALYSENCAACHGEQGVRGASISLGNPVYLAYAGEANIRTAIAKGVHGSLMPAFAQSSGGMLTDAQVDALAHGLITNWGKPDALAGAAVPAYHPAVTGSVADGEKVFASTKAEVGITVCA